MLKLQVLNEQNKTRLLLCYFVSKEEQNRVMSDSTRMKDIKLSDKAKMHNLFCIYEVQIHMHWFCVIHRGVI